MDIIIGLLVWGAIICVSIWLFQMFLGLLFLIIGGIVAGIAALFSKIKGQ